MLRLRGILCAVLAILVVGLTPIAYADPPDPTWFGGYWDDDDFDNVVAFIASATAVVASPVIDGRPFGVAEHCVELARPPARSAAVPAFAPPRPPPLALSSDRRLATDGRPPPQATSVRGCGAGACADATRESCPRRERANLQCVALPDS